jgi:dTDP-4-dehydrorhamnose 3,5-epimerase
VVIIETDLFQDDRGFFIESYHRGDFAAHGLNYEFVQDNHSRSARGVLRGLHYQDMRAPMAKLVRCTHGAILDVAVDLRAGSQTFGHAAMAELTGDNLRQLMVPAGFAHGFVALSDSADVQYKCSGYYAPEAEGTLAWNDPDIGIEWPIAKPLVSAKDSLGQSLREYRANPRFRYEEVLASSHG